MNIRVGIAAAALALVAATVGGLAATAGANGNGSGPTHFAVTATTTHFAFRGNQRSPMPGDYFVLEESLTRLHMNDRIGVDTIQCTYGFDGKTLCFGTYWFQGGKGQIDAQALLQLDSHGGPPSDFDIAVTGGTGGWNHARGTAHIHHTGANTSDITFDMD